MLVLYLLLPSSAWCPVVLMSQRRSRALQLCSWNVRGLGHRTKCVDVKANLVGRDIDVICLLENKLETVSTFKASSFLPPGFTSFTAKPSVGASGGILTAWNPRLLHLDASSTGSFSLTTTFTLLADGSALAVTAVYAPCTVDLRQAFLDEMVQTATAHAGHPWLLFGDFNLSRDPEDRNNDNFDVHAASLFSDAIDAARVQELPLRDRLYTWSSRRDDPTLVHLDRAFINAEWGSVLFNSTLTSLPWPVSDHVPIVVTASSTVPVSSVFRFEQAWTFSPAYKELVASVWARPQNASGPPVSRLVKSLKWVRAESKKWAKMRRHPGELVAACREALLPLDALEERRRLYAAELLLPSAVESRLSTANQELAVYWRQRYSFRSCRLGDENTKFFHASVSARLQRNHIAMLHDNAVVPVHSHLGKVLLLHTFYTKLLGKQPAMSRALDLQAALPLVPGLLHLDTPFSDDEARDALWSMRSSSSPGPDGFSPAFYKTFWPLVKGAVTDVLSVFHDRTADMEAINRAYLVLLPKKDVVVSATDF